MLNSLFIALPHRWDPFRIYCKTRSPAFEVCLNKVWKAGKISFFSTKCPQSNHTAGNDWMVIVWPCHHKFILHAARSPTFLWFFEPDSVKHLASVKWRVAIWQSDKVISDLRDKRRSSSNQCKRRTSGSTQFNKRLASKHQRRSPAHIMSYPDAISTFCERNPVYGLKQGSI